MGFHINQKGVSKATTQERLRKEYADLEEADEWGYAIYLGIPPEVSNKWGLVLLTWEYTTSTGFIIKQLAVVYHLSNRFWCKIFGALGKGEHRRKKIMEKRVDSFWDNPGKPIYKGWDLMYR